MIQAPRTRLAGVDAVRLIGLFAIVVGHVYAHNEFTDRFLQSWRLPLFFVLTGYFWSTRRNITGEVSKRGRSLLLPYVTWMLLFGALMIPSSLDTLGDLAESVFKGGSYAPRPFTSLWFLTALFVATVIYRLLEFVPAVVRLLVIIGGLVANVLAGEDLARVPLSIATALGALAFIAVGQWIRKQQDAGRVRAVHALVVLGIATVIAAFYPGDFEPVDMKYGHFPPVALATAAAVSAALIVLAASWQIESRRVRTLLRALTLPSLVVIVAHPFVTYWVSPESSPVPRPVIVLLALLLPLVAGLFLVQSPLAPFTAGLPRGTRPEPTTAGPRTVREPAAEAGDADVDITPSREPDGDLLDS